MSGRLTKSAYSLLVDDDIVWLERMTPDCLERRHIVAVLKRSIETEYPSSIDITIKDEDITERTSRFLVLKNDKSNLETLDKVIKRLAKTRNCFDKWRQSCYPHKRS